MSFSPPKRPPTLWERLLAMEEPPPWGQFTAISVCTISIFCFIVATIVTLPDGLLFASAEERWLALNLGASLNILLLLFRFRQPKQFAALRFSLPSPLQRVLYFIGWGLLLSFSLDLIGQILTGRILPPLELIDTFTQRVDLSLTAWLLAALFMLAGQPLVEETMLRGILYPAMRARLKGNAGLWVAILSNALAHTILHNALYGGLGRQADLVQYWLVIIAPFLAGFAFTLARVLSQSTLGAVLVHVGASVGALLKVFLI
ncbi:MAG: CPBP family intramembrane metalloprotease [Chloroflexi bacterium]|nr:CPBP family intramembrane metalloprotease [Chloroflexota bacterium]